MPNRVRHTSVRNPGPPRVDPWITVRRTSANKNNVQITNRMQSELTSTYDTDYKCEYKPRHYSEYLQLTPPSDWQTCLQRNVTLKRERTNAQHGCRFPARRGVSSPASAWVGVPSSQGCLACPDSPRVETMSDQKSTEILDQKLSTK